MFCLCRFLFRIDLVVMGFDNKKYGISPVRNAPLCVLDVERERHIVYYNCNKNY